MKAFSVLSSALACMATGFAAEPAELKFGGERIGVPPLGLAESAKRAATTSSPKFGAQLPVSSDPAESGALAPNLVPRTPTLRQLLPSKLRAPQVSRSSGMPIVIPNDAVDYAMTIVPPDPTIDYKLIVKDPGPGKKRNERSSRLRRGPVAIRRLPLPAKDCPLG